MKPTTPTAQADDVQTTGLAGAVTRVELPAAGADLPAPEVLLSGAGLPVDEFHGKGGTYVIENGVRRLAE